MHAPPSPPVSPAEGEVTEGLDLMTMVLEPSLEEVLDEGVKRLRERSTWKLWTWPMDGTEFVDADAFRAHVTVGRGTKGMGRATAPRGACAAACAHSNGDTSTCFSSCTADWFPERE